MITPPSSTPSFYSILFTAQVGTEVVRLMLPEPGKDIENVLITSLDLKSDVLAIVECQETVQKVAEAFSKEFEKTVDFNPIYLPNRTDLFENVEYDQEGDLTTVAGFGNPFITAHIKYNAPEQPDFIDASVCYKQFELPSVNELLKNEGKVLLS